MNNREQLFNDSEEAQRAALDGRQVAMWTATPGIIKSVNFTQMTCEVQPAIQTVVFDSNGIPTPLTLPLLLDVPIVFPGCAGFIITLPLAAGDEVLVVFSSRCIDAWWQQGGVQQAMEARMHDLSDGFAIPGPRSVPKVVSGISSSAVQIRNSAGTSYVQIDSSGKIGLVSGSEIDITAPLVNVTGNIVVTGTVEATAILGAFGTVAATGSVSAGGIDLATHRHTGVTTGGGDTGGPI